MIDLTIKTLDSQNHKFRVPDTYTILELKEYIAAQVNVAVVQQRLIFCGRVLSNETKLSDIGIHGKVMHLVQKVPRLSTTTSGSSSSTTTNTNSRSGQNAGPGFRGWHAHDPTVLFGAIGIPSELMHGGELPRLLSTRNHGTGNRVSLALDMIRKANEILNRLENPRSNGQSSATNAEQFPEGSQQAEATSPNVPPEGLGASESSQPESSASESFGPQTQTDHDSVNVSYDVDESFPNTVVVTIDATHHMRMPPGLMRQVHNHMQANNLFPPPQSASEPSVESEVGTDSVPVGGSTNQSSAEQATGTLPSSTSSEQNARNDRQTSENRSSIAINDRRRVRELIEQLNKLNTRLQPFYVMYCQYINEDPQIESVEGDNGLHRAQTVFNGVSEVMHYISHVYHAISDLRVGFHRPPPRSIQSRPCLLQGTILHTAHSLTTSNAGAPPSTQQPTSTQTTTTSQSIPSVRATRHDYRAGNETPNLSNSATETNTNMSVDPNTEGNNTSTVVQPDAPHGVEVLFDLPQGSIHIDSVESAFVNPTASTAAIIPPSASQPPLTGNETSNNVPMPMPMPMPIDWMDQMIDVISNGVRGPFISEQSLDWNSIPTTSTRTPRVTPRTTDSSATTNLPSQGISRGRLDNSPRIDPFLPCSSHHFESNLRPLVVARRAQGLDRSTSSATSGNSTTDTSPTSPNEIRVFTSRRPGRQRARYVQDSDGIIAGIHPVLTWARNNRNNAATTSASNIAQAAGQGSSLTDTLAGQIRVGMESVFDTLEREVNFDRTRDLNLPPASSSGFMPPMSTSTFRSTQRLPSQLLLTPIGDIPFFESISEGQSILVDLFLIISRNWTLHDMLNVNFLSTNSTLRNYPVSVHSEELVDFVLNRIMLNQPCSHHNIEAAVNRIYVEIEPYLNIFQCSVPTRTNIDVCASFRQCILQNLRGIISYCTQNRQGAIENIVSTLSIFAEGFLSLVVYCCNSRPVFRLCVAAVMQFLPLPTSLHRLVMDEIRANIDRYWTSISTFQLMSLSVVDYIVPFDESTRLSRGEQSSNPSLPSSEIINETLPEVVIGSQDWHHNVPSEWVPVIARDSQRQRRQGTQPPYSDAYLSGMPNKRRKIVTSSKPQGSLPQIIAKNLEVAMGAAGVDINKEVITSAGADTAVQTAYTERIRTFGRSGLESHPDFCPIRYPNASKFFYDNNHQN